MDLSPQATELPRSRRRSHARRAARLALGAGAILHLATVAPAAAAPIAEGALQIQGSRLTLYSDTTTTDAEQTIDVGERARVRTCYGGVVAACGTLTAGDPRVAGLLVEAELSGPELPQPIPLETVPGGAFLLPSFQQEGDYRLENIRLVDTASGRVLATSDPPLALLRVREILLASATVRALSLEELRQRGIAFDAENFQAFNFAVGFAFGSEIVEIELPVLYQGQGSVEPLAEPLVVLDGLPPDLRREVARWQPPSIVPFRLDPSPEALALVAGQEEDEALRFPLFGAIVLPGTVSYLNQFFEAKLVVANGADPGSAARLEDAAAALRLPPQNVLRLISTEPTGFGASVPVAQASGSRVLFPREQGSAAWTLEGLRAGTHTVQIDVTASLERPGRDPLPLLSRLQAAVEVVDARFNLTFSHPDVVREGEAYDLFVTVTNLSRATQNLITVEIDSAHLTGAHRAEPGDDLRRSIESLAAGEAATLEYRLVADLDGKVVATTFQSTSSGGQGTIRLRAGVGELGIPLSPATLVLPRFSERWKTPYVEDDEFHRAHTRFLGLAWSLAVAPAALTPPGLPRVIKSDVERRAVEFAEAGRRTFLGEPVLEALEVLALDYLGNRHPLVEIDELRRRIPKGQAFGVELGRLLRASQAEGGLDAEELFDHFAATTTYTAPYLGALLVAEDGSATPLGLEIVRLGPADGTLGGGLRTLPFAELFEVRAGAGGATVPLALIGHVELADEFLVVLRNDSGSDENARLLLVLPSADGVEDRRIEAGPVEVAAGGAVALRVGARVAEPRWSDLSTGAEIPAPIGSEVIERPPFRLIGAVQDFRLAEDGPDEFGNWLRPNRHGNGVLYLFNRPPDDAPARDGGNYPVRSTFDGTDTIGRPVSAAADQMADAAWPQGDERVVAVRYSTPISALIDPAPQRPLVEHQLRLDTAGLRDRWGEPLDPFLPELRVETAPLHVGGLVTGRVLRGTGKPVAGARVELIRPRTVLTATGEDTVLDRLGEVVTATDGVFWFDFVEQPHWDDSVQARFTLRATIPAGANPALEPGEIEEVSATIRQQNRVLRVNIALLGRGTVRGRVVYADDGSPVSAGSVRATSTLFNEERSVALASDGSFTAPGVPVGPITLTARDTEGRVVYATVGVAAPGDVVDVTLRMPRPIPGFGDVSGTVVGATSVLPVAGATVAVYVGGASLGSQATDSFGRFRFERLPAGQLTLQAAHWEVSRVAVVSDLLLVAGEEQDVTLRLPEGASRAVTGLVRFHDAVGNVYVPVPGAVAFIPGPGVFAYTDENGRYRIEGVPVQGAGESYVVRAIDFSRQLEGQVALPPILDVSPDPIDAQSIDLQQMRGGIDGIVLDPLGRPLGGAEVVVYPHGVATSQADGSFRFDDLPVALHRVVAHLGEGLEAGRVGHFAEAEVGIVYAGHRPFVSLRMVGAGVVNLLTRTADSTGVQTPIFYKPTHYSAAEYRVRLSGAYVETTTDPTGRLQLVLPVGGYELVAYNPFHGEETIRGALTHAGQIVDHEVVFERAATITGQVVGVDGVTPVPDAEVVLEATGLAPQAQRSDAEGRFLFELVPAGRVLLTAGGLAGNVERVGRTIGGVGKGQTLDLVIQMKARGSVSGRVLENFNGAVRPLSFAQYYLQEDSFPYRRIPEAGTWLVTDAEGRYTVPQVYAGEVTVVARDSAQVSRWGQARGAVSFDWQQVQLADIVMVTSVGSLQVTVRNPVSGGPVADAQVRLSNSEATVTDAEGVALFDALPLGTYGIYAFNAPTGQSGRLDSLALTSPGQHVARTVYLDQRGDVLGTVWDDLARTIPVEGATVRLDGQTAGGRVTALATTSDLDASLGRFEFLGIPEGAFSLTAAHPSSPRRATATAGLTATSPVADVHLVFERVGDVHFRLYEHLKGPTDQPVNLAASLFSTRLVQAAAGGSVYDFSQTEPLGGSGGVFRFPNVLLERGGSFNASELTGERRTGGAFFPSFVGSSPVQGAGTLQDPYQLVLTPKGAVRVEVKDAAGQAVAGASVTLYSAGGAFPSVTGADGGVSFAAVPAGGLNAVATVSANGTSGSTAGVLEFDDDVITLTVTLSPAVAAHGSVFLPVPGDVWDGDAAQLVAAPGIIVEMRDGKNRTQVVLTDEQGGYRFAALATGSYHVTARSTNGDQSGFTAGTLVGPNGFDNPIPAILLDAAPPRLVSIAPPPGLENVSRTAAVDLVFSEPLDPAVLPAGANPAPFFSLWCSCGRFPLGTWTSSIDPATGQQLVRFTPSPAAPYENFTVYSLTVAGGQGGVRDRVGRPLTSSANVGSTFKTSDSVGPTVIGTDPLLSRPVNPAAPIRFDFSEALFASDEQLDGDLTADGVELYGQADGGGGLEWRRLPVTTYLTRANYSLVMQAAPGVSLEGDTLQRRVVLLGFEDAYGNVMPTYERVFRHYDARPPRIDALPNPLGAADGQLLQGQSYTLVPALSGLDEVSAQAPGGDLDRVDYFLADPTDPERPVAPAYAARAFPYAYSFVAAYAGNNVDPRPFPVWARAVDTSTNVSNVVQVGLVVLPNTAPAIDTVAVAATHPVPGTFYAGTRVLATVGGFSDIDGSQMTLFVELWEEGGAAPIAATPGVLVQRPAAGWSAAPSQTASFDLVLTAAEGATFFVRARVLDPDAAVGVRESEGFSIADDDQPPRIDDFSVRLAGAPVTHLFLGEEFYVELRALDAETEIRTVEVTLDRLDLFPAPLVLTRVAGTADLYRTAAFTVPSGLDAFVAVNAALRLDDYGGNAAEASIEFSMGPERDPAAPQTRWHLPWPGALWPADYDSPVSAQGTALLLRFYARDTNLDGDGNSIPGRLVTVELRGPERNATSGEIELAADWTAAVKVPGTDDIAGAVYQGLWRVPNRIPAGTDVPFETRLVDAAGTETITRVTMTAVPFRQAYERAVTSVGAADSMLRAGGAEDGPVFLLDGTTLSLLPQPEPGDGSPRVVRRLPALFLYSGGTTESGQLAASPSILTAPEITTYDSAVLYHPLEMAIDHELAVAVESRIDMTGKGLLGSGARAMVLPGETPSMVLAGGSHGGRGGFGSPFTGWARPDLEPPGSVYGSVRDPRLPGGGGGSPDRVTPGGAGGGVVRVLADAARVRIDGEVRADGGASPGGGGAGGSIRLIATRLEGRGRIRARGSDGAYFDSTGGGGGGRIAIRYREMASTFDPTAQIDAFGGHNDGPVPSRANRRAGAGTILLEAVDVESGTPRPGRLWVGNPLTPSVAALTPLPALGEAVVVAANAEALLVTVDAPGAIGNVVGDRLALTAADDTELGSFVIVGQRRTGGTLFELMVDASPDDLEDLAAVLAAGTVAARSAARFETVDTDAAARLVAGGDLLLGIDEPAAINDRSRMTLRRGSRALLRGDRPLVTLTTVPAAESDVLLGSVVRIEWRVEDLLGLAETRQEPSFAASAVQTHYDDRLSVSSVGPTTFTVPVTGAPTSVAYSVEGRNLVGRSARETATWRVLPNALPLGTVTLAPSVTTPMEAGSSFSVVVRGSDREGLASVSLITTGPASPASQSTATAGTSAEITYGVTVSASADGNTPVDLRAQIVDTSGATALTETLSVPVVAQSAPRGEIRLAEGASAAFQPGESTNLVVQAEDVNGIERIDLHATAGVSPAEQSVLSEDGDSCDQGGGFRHHPPAEAGPTAMEACFELSADPDAELGTVVVTATIVDSLGNTFLTPPLILTITGDTTPPEIGFELYPDRGSGPYYSGEVLSVSAGACEYRDEEEPAPVFVELVVDGATITNEAEGGCSVFYEWTIPEVAEPTTRTLTAMARDEAGNEARALLIVELAREPVGPIDPPPTVTFTCPTPGALLPDDALVQLFATARDDAGIVSVRFYVDDVPTPFHEVLPTGTPRQLDTSATYQLGPDAASVVRFRVETTDTAGQAAASILEVETTTVVPLRADGSGVNNWSALRETVVALRGGVLTIDQPVTVAGLIVLDGARLTHSPGANSSLQLTVAGPTYVACSGAIDVSAGGFAPGTTYLGHRAAAGGAAGSHLGQGGFRAPATTGEVFGSVYRPREPGGGGAQGASGGGVVRLRGERVQVDGSIRANGASDATTPGGGGSLWINADEVAGSGKLEARGGDVTSSLYGSGGGGAIAVEYGAVAPDSPLLGGANVASGLAITSSRRGTTGTVYLLERGSRDGRLAAGHSALPSLGAGVAQAGSSTEVLATGRATVIPAYFVGHWIEIRSGTTGALEGTWRIASIDDDGRTVVLASNGGEAVTVNPGDRWQGVYRFDSAVATGTPAGVDPIRITGDLVVSTPIHVESIRARSLTVAAGGSVSPPTVCGSCPREATLTIEVDELVVEEGGVIDVSGRGYEGGSTYPDHALPGFKSGGGHLGAGGVFSTPAEAFGSVYYPREYGGGGRSSGFPAAVGAPGGGAVRIVAGKARVDGTIRANGGPEQLGGAGGSVWLTVGELAGVGSIEAKGGDASLEGSGGGGAVAVEYGSLLAGSSLLSHLSTAGGATLRRGGTGAIYLRSATSTYGELVVDNGAGGAPTVLPSLGAGVARPGSGGAVLVTDRTRRIPTYFVGQWVEIRDASTGALEGTWRVASIGADGFTLVLTPNNGELIAVEAADRWQGVYRFDRHTLRGEVVSGDPIRGPGEWTVTGSLEANLVQADRLVVEAGATVTQRLTTSATATETLVIEARELEVRPGGSIDVSARGYPWAVTYPAHRPPDFPRGGSHLGEASATLGFYPGLPGDSFGSVYFPRENGAAGGAEARGGGAVHVIADRVRVDGAIRANGEDRQGQGGGGGSVWIQAGVLAGSGVVEARGGNAGLGYAASGGGGAIAVEHGELEPGTTLLGHATAAGGSTGQTAGAGTVFLMAPGDFLGELIVDNGTIEATRRTVLPAIGRGAAQAGSAGASLVTDRPAAIPPYFVGHWVEVRRQDLTLKGTWRIASIGVDGLTLSLAPNGDEAIDLDAGDLWQGIYRFDRYTVRGAAQVVSLDPIHVSGDQAITGVFETDQIHADRLVVAPGATLTQRVTNSAAAPESLSIEVRELVVQEGGAIDVSARGYAWGVTYPGHRPPDFPRGGIHFGEPQSTLGFIPGFAGDAFGSVGSPRENGSGAGFGGRGGGAVRIVAERVEVDGAIRANGEDSSEQTGAGGSVWIRANVLAGSGSVEARGGNSSGAQAAGGGGAVAVEYGSLDPAATVQLNLSAAGGATGQGAGAGTVYLRPGGTGLGSLVVDGAVGGRRTVLPSLGRGIVQAGSSGATVLTGRDASIPQYFVGHWVEIEGPDRFVKGIWRIGSIADTVMTLVAKSGQATWPIVAGDRWRGVYRFEDINVAPGAILVSDDRIVQLVPPLPEARVIAEDGFGSLYGNEDEPRWDESAISIAVGAVDGSYRVTLGPGALADADGIAEVRLTSGGRSLGTVWSTAGVSFLWAGTPGQRLHLVGTDAHHRFARSAWLELPPLPDGPSWTPAIDLRPGVTPISVEGGEVWTAVGDGGAWLYYADGRSAGAVALAPPERQVVAMDADTTSLYLGTGDGLVAVEHGDLAAVQALLETRVPAGSLIDVLAADGRPLALLLDSSGPEAATLRVVRFDPASGAAISASEVLPALIGSHLVRTGEAVHLVGIGPDGGGSIITWPLASLGDSPTRTATAAWSATGEWDRGIVLVSGNTLRLLEYRSGGWVEAARIDTAGDSLSAAVAGDRLVVALAGEIAVYDISDPGSISLIARHPGSAYHAVAPASPTEVLLWSPRFAVPPLRWNPATALPGEGDGFHIVVDGVP